MTTFDPLIKFPCRCGHRFALPADRAASTIQCPRCGILNDIPTLSDLESISDDGTLIIKEEKTVPKRNRAAELSEFFSRGDYDQAGQERDLRRSHEELADVGADQVPLEFADEVRPAPPKYDPETGELVRPIALADDRKPKVDPKDIPVAKRAVSYASPDLIRIVSPGRILLEMLMPTNVVVALFVMVMHLLMQMTVFAMLGGMFLFAPLALAFTMLVLSHYANTVDEIGPEERDELPRPIRGVSLSEDIWRPFTHIAGALILCYAPACFANAYLPPSATSSLIISGLAALIGTFLFPAVFLTLATAGTLNNLRPDRLWGVIRVSGMMYHVAVLAWVATLAAYVAAFAGTVAFIIRISGKGGASGGLFLGKPAVVYPLLFVAIYITHFFCWHLGLIYRAHQPNFPWVHQRHDNARFNATVRAGAAIKKRRRNKQI